MRCSENSHTQHAPKESHITPIIETDATNQLKVPPSLFCLICRVLKVGITMWAEESWLTPAYSSQIAGVLRGRRLLSFSCPHIPQQGFSGDGQSPLRGVGCPHELSSSPSQATHKQECRGHNPLP